MLKAVRDPRPKHHKGRVVARPLSSSRGFSTNQGKREPTNGLEPLTCSLRVIGHVLQGRAGDCKCRIFKRFPFSGLLRVAPYCAPGGIRVVSTQPFLRAVGEADTASISPMRSLPVRSRGSLSSSTRDPAN